MQRTPDIIRSTRKLLPIACVAAIAISLAGCADRRAWTQTDSWWNPPRISQPGPGTKLDSSRVDLVSDAADQDAQALLANSPAAEISDEQAAHLVGLPLKPHPGARIYLLRGVYLRKSSGVFNVYVLSNGNIAVIFDCIGASPVPMRRQGIVAQLDKPPGEVFVMCSMTE